MDLLKKRWWQVLLVILLASILGFIAWSSFIPTSMPEAIAVLQSDDQVTVTKKPWFVF